MSLNLLAYAIPLIGGVRTIAAFHPANYRKYEAAPESAESAVVKEVAKRVLEAELQPAAAYRETIQELIQELPDSAAPKNIETFIATRLKVVSIKNEAMPIHSTGTAVDMGSATGKLFIAIDPDIDGPMKEALPWIATHELCHLLEGDWLEIKGIKTVVSLAVTVLSTAVFGWGLLPSIGATMLANSITHIALSHRAEQRADDFANQHCTAEERRQAIAYFEHLKHSRPCSRLASIIRSAFHPSEDARIANIQRTLTMANAFC
jgi:hypothetical protein